MNSTAGANRPNFARRVAISAAAVLTASAALAAPASAAPRTRNVPHAPPVPAEAVAHTEAAVAGNVPLPATAASDTSDWAGSWWRLADAVGATELWARGFTGAGVDIAVIDTGVSPVPGLADQLIVGPDLSLEAGIPELYGLDAFGHGTQLASIAAGADPDWHDDIGNFDVFAFISFCARVLSVKVGDNTGATDISQIIAGIDWVVQHGRSGDLNVRVISIAFDADGTEGYLLDPLSYAVENAWHHGYVVVVSAGNDGRAGRVLTGAAANPYVITVGSSDGDREVSKFSTDAKHGERIPDVLAPGEAVTGLVSGGSRLALEYPKAVKAQRFLRGSGTSQAGAVTAGAIALLLDARPDLTPDEVKDVLVDSAQTARRRNGKPSPIGVIDIATAAETMPTDATQEWPRATGLGSLEAARGGHHLVDADGAELIGEVAFTGSVWDPAAWTEAAAAGSSWSSSSWSGSSWSSSSWSGSSWSGSSWSGSSWSGSSWSGSSWSSSSWSGSSWSGSSWSGSSWSSSSWSSSSWSSSSWSSIGWR